MRILVLLPDNLSKPTGGLGVQLNEIKSRIKDITFDVVGQPDKEEEFYKPVFNDFPKIQHASLITATGQMQYFAEAIKRQKPDIVHAFDWSTYYAGYYVAQYFKVPLVVTMQLSINLLNRAGITYAQNPNTADGYWINQVHCEMEKLGLEKADKVIQVSNNYANSFRGIEKKTIVIPNGIGKMKSKNKVTLKPNSVVYIGRFATMKNIKALLEANIPKDINLYFIGNDRGGERHLFEAMKKKSEQENVHYLGEKYGQEKIDILCSADAVIVPSIHEPFGIVALEGLQSKSIVLSSWANGMADFLNKENSIYCGTTPESIENALHRFKNLTTQEKEQMIKKGLETCQKYTWESSAEQLKQVYYSLKRI